MQGNRLRQPQTDPPDQQVHVPNPRPEQLQAAQQLKLHKEQLAHQQLVQRQQVQIGCRLSM